MDICLCTAFEEHYLKKNTNNNRASGHFYDVLGEDEIVWTLVAIMSVQTGLLDVIALRTLLFAP